MLLQQELQHSHHHKEEPKSGTVRTTAAIFLTMYLASYFTICILQPMQLITAFSVVLLFKVKKDVMLTLQSDCL